MTKLKHLHNKLKINKNITYLGLVSFFTDISSEMLAAVLPLFLNNVLKLDKSIIGLIDGIADSTASILKVFSGWLTDKTQKRKPWILGGYSLSAAVKPILLIAINWPIVLLYRFLDRVGKGIRTAPRDTIIADFASEGERGKSFGFHRTMDTIGAIIGPAIAFLLMPVNSKDSLNALSYHNVFIASIIPGIFAVFVIVFFVREKESDRNAKKQLPDFSFSNLSTDYKKFLLISVILNLAVITDTFLLLRAQDLGITAKYIPVILLFFNVIQALFSIPAGMVSDYLGRKKVIMVGYMVFAVMSLGFAFSSRAFYVWLLFGLNGIFAALTAGVQKAFVVDLVNADVRGTALGTFNALIGVTALPSGLITGALWQMFGARTAFIFAALLSFLGVSLFFFWFRSEKSVA